MNKHYTKALFVERHFHFIFLALVYIAILLLLHFATGAQRISFSIDLPWILIGFLEVYLFSSPFYLLKNKSRFLYCIVLSVVTFIYSSLGFYHLREKNSFNYSVMAINADLIFNVASFKVMGGIFRVKDYLFVVALTLLPFVILFIPKKQDRLVVAKNRSILLLLLFPFFFITAIFVPTSYHEFSKFLRSVYSFYHPGDSSYMPSVESLALAKKNIFKKDIFGGDSSIATTKIEHVYIVFLESFNANYIDKKNENGKEYTPFFNKLKNEGLFFSNFFSNSVQTAKGQFSALCSRYPHSKHKVMSRFPNVKFRCLPEVMRQLGYRTLAMRAFANRDFDNMGDFQESHGFERVISMDDKFFNDEEKQKFFWGWGVQDDLFYKKSFEIIKRDFPSDKSFVTFSPLSNHMKFKGVPDYLKIMNSNPRNIQDNFGNTIHLMDKFLEVFFLNIPKNTLVVLVGDHGYPMGEHGNYPPENGFYNENFKTPLLIIFPDRSQRRIVENVSSSIDLAPTILDIIKAGEVEHSFAGKSLLSNNYSSSAVLIQPYDGRYISYVDNQIKYIHHVSTNRRFYFDLKNDPLELNRLPDSSEHFAQILKAVYLNDMLIEELH